MQGLCATCLVRANPAYAAEASGLARLTLTPSLCALFQGDVVFNLPQTLPAAQYLTSMWPRI